MFNTLMRALHYMVCTLVYISCIFGLAYGEDKLEYILILVSYTNLFLAVEVRADRTRRRLKKYIKALKQATEIIEKGDN